MPVESLRLSARQQFSKRALDLSLGAIFLLLVWWAILGAWVLARIDTQASGFFRQERVGLDGRRFNIIKIRTMRIVPGEASSVTTENDARVTRIGHFFRATKMDELPQLLNVLNGSMSIVGPRPTVQADYDRMTVEQSQRVNVRPGITGLAQVNGNTSLPWSKRIEFDLDYIRRWSPWLDIAIILRTLMMVASGRAETHPKGDDEW